MKDLLLRMKNLEKNTAPHEAIRNDHYDIVELLIREDPELASFTNNFGESSLFLAVDWGFYKIPLHIIETVPECSYGGRNNMNVLHAAVIRAQSSKYPLLGFVEPSFVWSDSTTRPNLNNIVGGVAVFYREKNIVAALCNFSW